VGILIAIGFVTAIVIVTLDQIRVTCDVCIEYRGRRICENAVAVDRAQAMQQATTAACAQLSAGVTDGIQCSNTPPVSATCAE